MGCGNILSGEALLAHQGSELAGFDQPGSLCQNLALMSAAVA